MMTKLVQGHGVKMAHKVRTGTTQETKQTLDRTQLSAANQPTANQHPLTDIENPFIISLDINPKQGEKQTKPKRLFINRGKETKQTQSKNQTHPSLHPTLKSRTGETRRADSAGAADHVSYRMWRRRTIRHLRRTGNIAESKGTRGEMARTSR